MKKELTVLETFSGIGAPRKALIRGEYNFKIVDSIEIDPNPVRSYNAIYGDDIEPQDISKWNKTKEELGEIDLIWNSSPCQSFSIAGKNEGGEEGSGTRSSLVYEVLRIAKEFMPKYIVWENVKGLTTSKHKPVLDDYINKLEEMGYSSQWKILNSKNYDVAQTRDRVFVVSIRKDVQNDFQFPNRNDVSRKVNEFIDQNVDSQYFRIVPSMMRAIDDGKCKIIDKNGICNTITTKQERWNNAGFLNYELGLRYFTEKEVWRLMGFDDEDFNKAANVHNNRKSILYKQAGNSVVVNVIQAIFDNLLKDYQ